MVVRSLPVVLIVAVVAVCLVSCDDDDGGPPALSEEFVHVIGIVTNTILPSLVPDGATFNCIRMSGPIPAGSIIQVSAPSNLPTDLQTDAATPAT